MRPYNLHMVQAIRAGHRAKRVEFSNAILRNIDDNFLPRLVFSDEETFHISGKVNLDTLSEYGTGKST